MVEVIMRCSLLVLIIICGFWLFSVPVNGQDVPLGVHILEPGELEYVLPYRGESSKFYVTVPMVITDRRTDVWQRFFEDAFKAGITPLVRWVTLYKNGSWQVPTRQEIVDASKFLSSLNWPGERTIILFNEPNHALEWGGKVDPEGYAETAAFAASWLKTEKVSYTVLPAGLDAAAPNNGTMIDSLRFIERMYRARPELFDLIDGWTSHSYPNPGFSATAYRTGKNSLRGYDVELRKLHSLTGKQYVAYITETGWKQSRAINRQLPAYYQYAVKNIWNDERVKAVTVFLLRGFKGPFEDFSLLDSDHKPTTQMQALMKAAKWDVAKKN